MVSDIKSNGVDVNFLCIKIHAAESTRPNSNPFSNYELEKDFVIFHVKKDSI